MVSENQLYVSSVSEPKKELVEISLKGACQFLDTNPGDRGSGRVVSRVGSCSRTPRLNSRFLITVFKRTCRFKILFQCHRIKQTFGGQIKTIDALEKNTVL